MDSESSDIEGKSERSSYEPAVPVLGYRAPAEDARREMPYKTQVRVGASLGVLYMLYCTLTGLRMGASYYSGMSIVGWFWVAVRWLPFLVAAKWAWGRRKAGWGPGEVRALLMGGGLMIWTDLGRWPLMGAGPIAGLLSGGIPLLAAMVVTLSRPRWRGIGVGLIIGAGVTLLIGVGGVVVICGNMRF